MTKILIRRGISDNLPTLAYGELGWTSDDNKLYIGTAAGNKEIGGDRRVIQWDITPGTVEHSEGQLHWNEDDKTLEIDTEVTGTAIQIGQEMVLRVTNKSGVDIQNGTVVYVNGVQGQRPTVALADSDTAITSHTTVGFATNLISDNNTGYITVFGLVRGLNTVGYTPGDVLYLSQTPGQYTTTIPQAPAHAVKLGHVLYNHSDEGVVLADVELGRHFDELHDVTVTSAANQDIIWYESAQSRWVNATLANSLDPLYIDADGDTMTGDLIIDAASGALIIADTASPTNAGGLTIGDGLITMKETTVPTADANYAKIWTQSDNNLYFQDGSGTSHILHGFPISQPYTITTQGLGVGASPWAGGFYLFSTASAWMSQSGGVKTWGNASVAYAAHAFAVLPSALGEASPNAPGELPDVAIRVTGTTINDQGSLQLSDSEVLTSACYYDVAGQARLRFGYVAPQYLETSKKFLGTVTFEAYYTSGSTDYGFPMNFGFCKYDDYNNNNFVIKGIEVVGYAGGNDSDIDFKLLHHNANDSAWEYSGAAFTPITSGKILASLATDHSTWDQIKTRGYFAWKRDNLDTFVEGSNNEGMMISTTTTAVNAIEYANIKVFIES